MPVDCKLCIINNSDLCPLKQGETKENVIKYQCPLFIRNKASEALQDLRDVRGWNYKEYRKRLDVIERQINAMNILKRLAKEGKIKMITNDLTNEEWKLLMEEIGVL